MGGPNSMRYKEMLILARLGTAASRLGHKVSRQKSRQPVGIRYSGGIPGLRAGGPAEMDWASPRYAVTGPRRQYGLGPRSRQARAVLGGHGIPTGIATSWRDSPVCASRATESGQRLGRGSRKLLAGHSLARLLSALGNSTQRPKAGRMHHPGVTAFTESVVEEAALAWLEGLGYAVGHGPDSLSNCPPIHSNSAPILPHTASIEIRKSLHDN